MYAHSRYFAPAVVVILTLFVLDTDQTLFSKKKVQVSAPVDPNGQYTVQVPQKEHWWQVNYVPEQQSETAGTSHVSVALPLANLHHKLQSIIEAHHSDIKWVPCLCPVKKTEKFGGLFHHSPAPPVPQEQSIPINNAPRYIVANYPIEP
ncbi:uncharacterized protein LOC126907268 [Daktulosphaira vitifoliae]|uniref:uncharacterized protein LOC126907268 n=1 Tax=Daktulosphaira vitifoliae TaxID=58002 RepID=UPI0021AA99DE|nr:uncharacterized protein LOC126907268 [Daktulosphaira vitifoliae]